MGIQERIAEFLRYKKLTYRDMERVTGLSNGALAKIHERSRASSFDRISKTYPELNIDWLLTGNGEMIKPQQLYVNGNNNISNISNTGDIVNVGSCSKEEIIDILKEVRDKQDEILKILLTQRKK